MVLRIKSKVDNIVQNFCYKIKGNRVRYTALVFGQAKSFNYLANGQIKKALYETISKKHEKNLIFKNIYLILDYGAGGRHWHEKSLQR